jgi:hypothetical protein
VFKYTGKLVRKIGHDFPLHDSVIERLTAGLVLQYDHYADYRPGNLKGHDRTKQYYPLDVTSPAGTP